MDIFVDLNNMIRQIYYHEYPFIWELFTAASIKQFVVWTFRNMDTKRTTKDQHETRITETQKCIEFIREVGIRLIL